MNDYDLFEASELCNFTVQKATKKSIPSEYTGAKNDLSS